MAISLTKEEFVKRIQERSNELSFPIEEMKANGVAGRIFSQSERGTNVNLGEVKGYYVSHLLDVIYRESK